MQTIILIVVLLLIIYGGFLCLFSEDKLDRNYGLLLVILAFLLNISMK